FVGLFFFFSNILDTGESRRRQLRCCRWGFLLLFCRPGRRRGSCPSRSRTVSAAFRSSLSLLKPSLSACVPVEVISHTIQGNRAQPRPVDFLVDVLGSLPNRVAQTSFDPHGLLVPLWRVGVLGCFLLVLAHVTTPLLSIIAQHATSFFWRILQVPLLQNPETRKAWP